MITLDLSLWAGHRYIYLRKLKRHKNETLEQYKKRLEK